MSCASTSGNSRTTLRRPVTVSNFDESVGGGTGEIAALMNMMRKILSASSTHATQVPLAATGLTDASGNAIIDLGVAPQGFRWRLRSLVIGGTTWSTTATGTALLFVSPSPPQALTLP